MSTEELVAIIIFYSFGILGLNNRWLLIILSSALITYSIGSNIFRITFWIIWATFNILYVFFRKQFIKGEFLFYCFFVLILAYWFILKAKYFDFYIFSNNIGEMPFGFTVFFMSLFSMFFQVRESSKKNSNKINFLEMNSQLLFYPRLFLGPIPIRFNFIKNKDIDIVENSLIISLGLLFLSISSMIDGRLGGGTIQVSTITRLNLNPLLVGLIIFLRLYLNFSGFSLIVNGLMKSFGFEGIENFKFPFGASSPQTFWNNWHISLSLWFKTFVYYPVAFKMISHKINSNLASFLSTFFTFLLIGIWHGVSGKMILWSVVNTILVMYFNFPPKIVFRVITFILMFFVFSLFNSLNIESYLLYLKLVFSKNTLNLNLQSIGALLRIMILFVLVYVLEKINFLILLKRVNKNLSFLLIFIYLFISFLIGLDGISLTYRGF